MGNPIAAYHVIYHYVFAKNMNEVELLTLTRSHYHAIVRWYHMLNVTVNMNS